MPSVRFGVSGGNRGGAMAVATADDAASDKGFRLEDVPRPEIAALENPVAGLEAQVGRAFRWLPGRIAATLASLCALSGRLQGSLVRGGAFLAADKCRSAKRSPAPEAGLKFV